MRRRRRVLPGDVYRQAPPSLAVSVPTRLWFFRAADILTVRGWHHQNFNFGFVKCRPQNGHVCLCWGGGVGGIVNSICCWITLRRPWLRKSSSNKSLFEYFAPQMSHLYALDAMVFCNNFAKNKSSSNKSKKLKWWCIIFDAAPAI